MSWILLPFIAGIIMACHNLMMKLAAGKISPLASVVVLVAVALFFLGIGLFIPALREAEHVETTSMGVIYSALAGVGLAALILTLQYAFSIGAPMSSYLAVYYTIAIGLSVVLGVILLGENPSTTQSIGILMALVSVGLIIKG